MKSYSITSTIFLLLVYAATEINITAFNIIFYSNVDPSGLPVFYGNPWFEALFLITSLATFGIAGWIIAWRICNRFYSVISAVLIGTLALGVEYSLSVPWFLLMPSHPDIFDRVIAFLGPSIPPIAGIVGVLLFNKFYGRGQEENVL